MTTASKNVNIIIASGRLCNAVPIFRGSCFSNLFSVFLYPMKSLSQAMNYSYIIGIIKWELFTASQRCSGKVWQSCLPEKLQRFTRLSIRRDLFRVLQRRRGDVCEKVGCQSSHRLVESEQSSCYSIDGSLEQIGKQAHAMDIEACHTKNFHLMIRRA